MRQCHRPEAGGHLICSGHIRVIIQMHPCDGVGQLGGMIKHHAVVVQRQMHVRQFPVVWGRPTERQLACTAARTPSNPSGLHLAGCTSQGTEHPALAISSNIHLQSAR